MSASLSSTLDRLFPTLFLSDVAASLSPSDRSSLRGLLISSSATTLSTLTTSQLSRIDALLAAELSAEGGGVDGSSLPVHASPLLGSYVVSVWRGDITRLKVGAIVNAANGQLLGCFQPEHRCVDNVIHAAAGPRLRLSCASTLRSRLEERPPSSSSSVDDDAAAADDDDDVRDPPWSEPVGQAMSTPAFSLPSSFVLHTVGPSARFKGEEQPELLASCYKRCLDVASEMGLHDVAFCCISTGIFGYPAAPAALVACEAVRDWFASRGGDRADVVSSVKRVVFCTFSPADEDLYRRVVPAVFAQEQVPVHDPAPTSPGGPSAVPPSSATQFLNITPLHPSIPPAAPTSRLPASLLSSLSDEVRVAASWLSDADAVFVVAGAGMSAVSPFNVYVSPSDFELFYPGLPRYGYSTGYECMGLQDDGRVPLEVRQGFLLSHMANMRWRFPLGQHEGYGAILRMAQSKPLGYQVLTSNVDGAFLRAGFDPTRVYRPQGDWEWIQCKKGSECSSSSYWPSQPLLESLLPLIDPATQRLSSAQIPMCPNCGGVLMGNVRGGDWFLHHPALDQAQDRLIQWGEGVRSRAAKDGAKVVVVEVGCGWNTPIVTRLPAESFVRDTPGARLIRINPTDPEVPADLADRAVSIATGWEVLLHVEERVAERERQVATEIEEEIAASKRCAKKIKDAAARGKSAGQRRGGYATGMDWKDMLLRLKK